MDYMDPYVHCPKKADKLNRSLTRVSKRGPRRLSSVQLTTYYFVFICLPF